MDKQWRPNNWLDIKWDIMRMGKNNPTYKGGMLAPDAAYEVGAGAMLEALKGEAVYRNYIGQQVTSEPSVLAVEVPNRKGWLIFLEDEEVK